MGKKLASFRLSEESKSKLEILCEGKASQAEAIEAMIEFFHSKESAKENFVKFDFALSAYRILKNPKFQELKEDYEKLKRAGML